MDRDQAINLLKLYDNNYPENLLIYIWTIIK